VGHGSLDLRRAPLSVQTQSRWLRVNPLQFVQRGWEAPQVTDEGCFGSSIGQGILMRTVVQQTSIGISRIFHDAKDLGVGGISQVIRRMLQERVAVGSSTAVAFGASGSGIIVTDLAGVQLHGRVGGDHCGRREARAINLSSDRSGTRGLGGETTSEEFLGDLHIRRLTIERRTQDRP
jgi:hypothetical protein